MSASRRMPTASCAPTFGVASWLSVSPGRAAGSGQDFLRAFSGKGRAVCPSCTSRRMAETAFNDWHRLFYHLPRPGHDGRT